MKLASNLSKPPLLSKDLCGSSADRDADLFVINKDLIEGSPLKLVSKSPLLIKIYSMEKFHSSLLVLVLLLWKVCFLLLIKTPKLGYLFRV